ncbi:uncharacterized protein HMPREF1541_10585 [Cyphellophora europaea CBS 101466]|uniref:Transcription factor domain-containing protein n=1 Tax=Cyphellophora europaea (strain CBS 101466) TaxID=1220924 RepID=W2S716_CYPE1|nr:uncharacterized protein HMPREF1541_10585 [Cyphellophora europaea CBS 101466]ETN44405.1 hypothetical protein HMPREF1541_10585 [Cyphellophora europaea CBS 101466]
MVLLAKDASVAASEKSRIIRNATRCVPNVASGQPATIDVPDPISTASSTTSGFTHNLSLSISPSQPLEEIGANFFFTKYGFELPPTFAGHTTWLSQTYFSGHHVLRPTIEAVGMAGLSNIRDEPSIMSLAKRRSQEAVIATKKALNDPVEGLADETFMAVILLAFFEFISFEDWTRYGYWLEHIKAATALLELRGPKQFTRVRGAQLLVQVRSPILAACLQQRLVAPPAIVQATWQFETAPIRDSLKSRYIASPASISEISLRLVNLRAAAKNLHKDIESVRRAALVIDNDLKAWREVVSPAWLYQTVESSTADDTFGGKKQVYNIPWVAEVWNNWRALRIAVYQVVLLGENIHTPGMDKVNDAAVEVIRQMSEEICISVSAFTENR